MSSVRFDAAETLKLKYTSYIELFRTARLRIEWSRFGSWPGTLCCVLGQDTLLPRCLSPPRCINGYRRNSGGSPAMDWHPIQGGVKNSPSRFMPQG